MTYPLSSPVVAGDPTEADQYNNLRSDALYLGGNPTGSGNLLQLLYQSMGMISLTRVSATTIRLNASASSPCALMIGGTIFAVDSDKSILLTALALPTAGRYYVYAVAQSDGSFILDAGDNNVPVNGRMIGTFLWDGSGVIPGTLHNASEWEAIRSVVKPSIANGRLTLASGIPVSDADIVAADTLYFTPYNGNEIALYIGGEWVVFSFEEISLSLSGLTSELPYDIFLSADANGLKLSAAQWGSASARLTTLVYFDGVQVSGADYGKRYLGTIALNSNGYGEDSQTGRLVWNENNRVDRPLLSKITSNPATISPVMNKWAPYLLEKAATVRLLVPNPDTTFDLTGTGIGSIISESDASYTRAEILGIGKDIMMESPYTDNASCVPVFVESYGNAPMNVNIRNYDSSFRGYHKYTLVFYTNYSFVSRGLTFSAIGAGPGLHGIIRG